MEENELYNRIGETDLNPTYKDGQTYQHTDINQMLGILKTAINENYYDIQRLQNGEKTVGNANQLDGATLSRYIDEELQADDDKIPSSQQAKAYMDALFAGYSAPTRGVDYWTEADQQQIVSDATNSVQASIMPGIQEALDSKASASDIPTNVSELSNDVGYLVKNDLKLVDYITIQDGFQVTDATGYARVNKILGNSYQYSTSGAQLFDKDNANIITGYVSASGKISRNSTDKIIYIPCLPNTTYTIQKMNQGTTSANRFRVGTTDVQPDYNLTLSNFWKMSDGGTTTSHTITTGENASYLVFYCYSPDELTTFNELLSSVMISDGSTEIPYEQYTGNNPSPSQTYPQSVEPVSGNVVLSIFNSTSEESKTFNISLGDIKLFKVNAYQDYIYNNSDKWYLHKEVAKIDSYNGETVGNDFISTTGSLSTGATVYYGATQPTETEILDTNLLKELNKLKNIELFLGSNRFAITSGNSKPSFNAVYSLSDLDNYSKEETNDLILKSFNDVSANLEFIFFKSFTDMVSGDCCIVKYKDQIIMIDTYSTSQYSFTKQMLDDNNITHIDYVIITHYHADHVGGFKSLVEDGYITSDTKTYFPAPVTNFYASYPEQYQAYCEEHGIMYNVPTEYEELRIDDLKLTFFNCDATTLDRLYYTEATRKDYNNCSTVVKINFKDIQCLFTGDCLTEALYRIYNSKFVKGEVDLYKIEHHGIETTTCKELIFDIKPKMSYQPSGIMDYQTKVLFATSEISKLLEEINCNNYIMFQQEDYVRFVTNGEKISCISGRPGLVGKTISTYTYYVDKNATYGTFADGSQEYPFNEINQVFGVIRNKPNTKVTINLANGYYGLPDLEFRKRGVAKLGKDVKVILNGNSEDNTLVQINGLDIHSCNMEINNLTLDVDNYEGFYCRNSDVILTNVRITSLTETVRTDHSCLISRENSTVSLYNCYLDYGNEGIIASNSNIRINSLTVGSHINTNHKIHVDNTNNLITNNITFESNSDKIANNTNRKIVNSPQILYSGETQSNITLPKSATNFDWFEISYSSDYSVLNTTGKIRSNDISIPISMPVFAADGNVYLNGAYLVIHNMTVSILRNRQVVLKTDGTTEFKDEAHIYIKKIVAGFNECVDYSQ